MSEKQTDIKRVIISFIFLVILQACAVSNDLERESATKGSDLEGERPLAEVVEEGLQIDYNQEHPRVQQQIARFESDNITIFSHLDEEGVIMLKYILAELNRRGLPAELAFIPLVESSYRPDASNRGHHVGLWQLGGPTARVFGVEVGQQIDGRYNIKASTDAALTYLEYLNKMFDGDWLLTMAAYNAGEGRVLGSIKRNQQADKKADYWSLSLPNVTQEYIPKVLALSQLALEEERLDIPTEEIPKLVELEVSSLSDLKEIVDDEAVIQRFNPQLNASALDHYAVLLPHNTLKRRKLEELAIEVVEEVEVTGEELVAS